MEQISRESSTLTWWPADVIVPEDDRAVLVIIDNGTWLKAVYEEYQWWADMSYVGSGGFSGIGGVKYWADVSIPLLEGINGS